MFFTRMQHDLILTEDKDLLINLFDKFSHSWGVAGVTFRNVPDDIVFEVNKIIFRRPPT